MNENAKLAGLVDEVLKRVRCPRCGRDLLLVRTVYGKFLLSDEQGRHHAMFCDEGRGLRSSRR